jgi:hypothetical protein
MKSLLFVALFIFGAFGQQFVFQSNTNVTLSNGNMFQFRNVQFTEVNFGIGAGVAVASTSVTANPTSATFDGLYGQAYAGLTVPPTSWVLFVDVAAKFNGIPTNISANVSGSDGFIGSTFISIDELFPNGTVAYTVPLGGLAWAIVDQSVTGDVKYITLEGKDLIFYPGVTVRISYIVANRVGLLNVGPVSVVTPKSIESVVNITNFPYKNAGDSLRLNLGVATQAATVLVTGQYTHLTGGSGNGATYFSLNKQAVVGGQVQPVSISAFVTATSSAQIQNGNIVGQVTAKYGAAANFQLVSVTFPAGATTILYDPSTGAGAPPPAITGSANSFAVPLALLFLMVILLL